MPLIAGDEGHRIRARGGLSGSSVPHPALAKERFGCLSDGRRAADMLCDRVREFVAQPEPLS